MIIHLAERLSLDGKLAKAVELLEKEARRSPRKTALWMAWSEMLILNGSSDAALKVLEEASQPDNIHAGDHANLRIARRGSWSREGTGVSARPAVARHRRRYRWPTGRSSGRPWETWMSPRATSPGAPRLRRVATAAPG